MRENLEPCGSLKEDWKKGILEPVRFIANVKTVTSKILIGLTLKKLIAKQIV